MNKVYFKPSEDYKVLAKEIFQKQKERVLELISEANIEHIGSTAIAGSLTKGELDLNVRVKQEDFGKAIEELKKIYQINQPENWTSSFASFKDDDNFELPVGIQLTVIDSEYDDFVKLRDLLINNPKLLEEYNSMKQEYEGKEMDEYRKEKSDFFEKLRKYLK